jgi:ATP synthase F1 delta subunit
MAELTVERVYGEALFEAADDLGQVEDFRNTLQELQGIFRDNLPFFEMLRSPSLSAEEKKKALAAVFEGRLTTELLNFLYVLVDKRRLGQFAGIVRGYNRLADESCGIAKGTAVSAVPLSEEQIQSLESEAGKLLSRNIKLDNEVDPAIVGGVCLYIDGKIIDASIRKKIDDLKERIV